MAAVKPSARLSAPQNIRDVVTRNILSSEGPWILINLKATPTTVIDSGDLSRDVWIDAISALEDQAAEAIAVQAVK